MKSMEGQGEQASTEDFEKLEELLATVRSAFTAEQGDLATTINQTEARNAAAVELVRKAQQEINAFGHAREQAKWTGRGKQDAARRKIAEESANTVSQLTAAVMALKTARNESSAGVSSLKERMQGMIANVSATNRGQSDLLLARLDAMIASTPNL